MPVFRRVACTGWSFTVGKAGSFANWAARSFRVRCVVIVHRHIETAMPCQLLRGLGRDAALGQVGDVGVTQGVEVCYPGVGL